MTFIQYLEIRKRCVKALLVREAKRRFGSSFGGLIMAFFEPLVQVAFFSSLFYLTGRPTPHGTNIFAFVITGVIPYHLFAKTMTKSMTGIDANKTLLSYPILKPIDTIVSRILLEVLIYTIVFSVLVLACLYLGLIEEIFRPGYLVLALLFAISLGGAFAILFAALLSFFQQIKIFVPIFVRIGLFTSGVFFSISMLPQFARELFLWNPMMHVSEMIRYSVFMDYPPDYISISYFIAVNFGVLTLGTVLLDFAQKSPKARIRNN